MSKFVPLVEELFYALDAQSVSILDAHSQDILEPGVNETPLWDSNVVKALFDIPASVDDAEPSEALHQKLRDAAAPFAELQNLAFRFTTVEDQDWVRKCLDQFKPIELGSRLRIVPSWEDISPSHFNDVRLDPGLAFGTGTHETTFLCLQWLDEKFVASNRVVDFGCGSGILGIAALKLGAKHAYFIDNDPQAITASEQNLKANEIEPASYTLIDSSDAAQSEILNNLYSDPADLILANILAKTLLSLQESVATMVKCDGTVLLSGILEEQTDVVLNAYKKQFYKFEIAEKQSWIRISATRKC